MNIFGSSFQVLTFGESHGPAIGAVIEGLPAGVVFSEDLIREKLKRRRPGYFPWLSARKEPDEPELLSGVFEGRSLGTPLALLVRNTSARPKDYDFIKENPRPGHADDLWRKKFGWVDHRGGGRASGRETLGRVLGGAVAEMFLKQIHPLTQVRAFPIQIGPFVRKDYPDFSKKSSSTSPEKNLWFGQQSLEVENFLVQKKAQGLSYGGTIEVRIDKPPALLGQPVFAKLKSDFSSAFMGIGACYALSLGDKELCLEEGSQLHLKAPKTVYGGIRGGLSTGESIVFQLKFKPPASVLNIAKKGRHDPCIVPRAVVVVEAMAWLVLADHVLKALKDRLPSFIKK